MTGVWRWAEGDDVIRGLGACEGAAQIIVGVAVRTWARGFEDQRVRRRFTRVRRSKRAAAAIFRRPKRLARAFASHRLFSSSVDARHPQLRRTRAVQIHDASRAAAVLPRASLRDDEHRDVVSVDEADVVEIETVRSVERELG